MNCGKCGIEIPQERLEAIPETTTCVKCSDVKRKICFMDWYHKTAPELVVVNAENKEDVRRAIRQNRRSR